MAIHLNYAIFSANFVFALLSSKQIYADFDRNQFMNICTYINTLFRFKKFTVIWIICKIIEPNVNIPMYKICEFRIYEHTYMCKMKRN